MTPNAKLPEQQRDGSSIKDAGDWIGDSDLKSLRKYLKKREGRQREVADMVRAPKVERTI